MEYAIEGDLQSIKSHQTSNKFSVENDNAMLPLTNGQQILGITNNINWYLLSENFKTNEILEFSQSHRSKIITVVYNQALDFVLSAGMDTLAVIYDIKTGNSTKIIDMGKSGISTGVSWGEFTAFGLMSTKEIVVVNITEERPIPSKVSFKKSGLGISNLGLGFVPSRDEENGTICQIGMFRAEYLSTEMFIFSFNQVLPNNSRALKQASGSTKGNI